MEKKIPSEWALKLAELHNHVMELQDEFSSIKDTLYSREEDDILELGVRHYNLNALEEEVENICDVLDDLEITTSELDIEYNDYE